MVEWRTPSHRLNKPMTMIPRKTTGKAIPDGIRMRAMRLKMMGLRMVPRERPKQILLISKRSA